MSPWMSYENGLTIGEKGSENGTIICDEEYLECCRITLEKTNRIPYSITCGIYGFMCHTTFAGTKQEAQEKYECMKSEMKDFIDAERDETTDISWLVNFVKRW